MNFALIWLKKFVLQHQHSHMITKFLFARLQIQRYRFFLSIYGSIFLNPFMYSRLRVNAKRIPFGWHRFWKEIAINIRFMFSPNNTITNIDQSAAVTIKPALNLNAFKYFPCAWRWNGAKISRTLFSARYNRMEMERERGKKTEDTMSGKSQISTWMEWNL